MLKSLLYCHKESNKIAIIEKNKKITYREWYNLSYSLAIRISKEVNQGAHVLLYVESGIQYCIGYFAIIFANCVVIPHTPSNTDIDVVKKVNDLQINLILTDKFSGGLELSSIGCRILIMDNNLMLNKKLEIKNNLDNNSKMPAIILSTSGTTGRSKYAVLSHSNLYCNINAHIASIDISSNDVGLIMLPINLSYCNTSQFLVYTKLGITFIIESLAIYPPTFVNIVKYHNVTITNITPPILQCLLEYGAKCITTLNSLHHICIGTMGINKYLWRNLIDKIHNCKIYSTYGMTEMSPRMTTLPNKDFFSKIGSVGLPLQGVDMKINKNKNNDIGEILVKGNGLMLGYYKNNENFFDKYGYFKTGDLGYFDKDGYLFITGRKKNIIINNGINICPEEIEDIIEQYPGVKRAYVYGEENKLCGEVPVAKIEVKKNIDIKDIENYCKKSLPTYKIPHKIIIVDNIEKNKLGKIKRIH